MMINSLKKIVENEINRNGQIYYVTPKISDQISIKKRILKTMPDLKFAIINGKLNLKILKIFIMTSLIKKLIY